MLPKLVVVHSGRALEAAVNPRGQIIFAFPLGWHVEHDASEQIRRQGNVAPGLDDQALFHEIEVRLSDGGFQFVEPGISKGKTRMQTAHPDQAKPRRSGLRGADH